MIKCPNCGSIALTRKTIYIPEENTCERIRKCNKCNWYIKSYECVYTAYPVKYRKEVIELGKR